MLQEEFCSLSPFYKFIDTLLIHWITIITLVQILFPLFLRYLGSLRFVTSSVTWWLSAKTRMRLSFSILERKVRSSICKGKQNNNYCMLKTPLSYSFYLSSSWATHKSVITNERWLTSNHSNRVISLTISDLTLHVVCLLWNPLTHPSALSKRISSFNVLELVVVYTWLWEHAIALGLLHYNFLYFSF